MFLKSLYNSKNDLYICTCVFHGIRFKVCGGCRETSSTFLFLAVVGSEFAMVTTRDISLSHII